MSGMRCVDGYDESEHWRDGHYACPATTAPRPESGGQQQAAAELMETHIRPDGSLEWVALQNAIAAALAEAARPGQELRARVEALADEWEKRRDWQGITGTTWAADELRAALEDPR